MSISQLHSCVGRYSCMQGSNECSLLCQEDVDMSGYTCHCPQGYTFLDDGTTCISKKCADIEWSSHFGICILHFDSLKYLVSLPDLLTCIVLNPSY